MVAGSVARDSTLDRLHGLRQEEVLHERSLRDHLVPAALEPEFKKIFALHVDAEGVDLMTVGANKQKTTFSVASALAC